jgi:hypothetical protein
MAGMQKWSMVAGVLYVGVLLVPAAGGDLSQRIIGHFSVLPQENELPVGWEPLVFEKIDVHTTYRHLVEDGRGVVRADSKAGSSGLVHKERIAPEQWPVISWSWKVDRILDNGDASKKSGDDYPARLYITFAYDADKVGFWEGVKFKALKLLYGEYPPINALTYIWANKMAKETLLANPYTSRVQMIAVESGAEHVGTWRTASRNIVEDYRRAFGEEPPAISGIAIMTDTDNTGEEATAWYGDIILVRP